MRQVRPFDRIAEIIGTSLTTKLAIDFHKATNELEERLCADINAAVSARISLTLDELAHLTPEAREEAMQLFGVEYNQSLACLTSRVVAQVAVQCDMGAAQFIRHTLSHFEDVEESALDSESGLLKLMDQVLGKPRAAPTAPAEEGVDAPSKDKPKDLLTHMHEDNVHRAAKRHSSGN